MSFLFDKLGLSKRLADPADRHRPLPCKLSISHFRRLFRATFRETPAKYALRLRLNRARKALESSRDTVASIAFDTGFYDQSHLIKAFRAVYKMTPEKYRQRHIGIPTGRKQP